MASPRPSALARQLERYYVRFNGAFWEWFASDVRLVLPEERPPTIADLGCGPGLFLRDVRERLHQAKLIGIDSAADMLEYARELDYVGEPPAIIKGDVTGELPLLDSSVDLLTITAVMHTFNDPFSFLDEARRVLAPGGMLLVYDWVRVPFREYIDYRRKEPGDPDEVKYPRALEMFATHNKYTADDWMWLFEQGRFEVTATSWPYVRAMAVLAKPV